MHKNKKRRAERKKTTHNGNMSQAQLDQYDRDAVTNGSDEEVVRNKCGAKRWHELADFSSELASLQPTLLKQKTPKTREPTNTTTVQTKPIFAPLIPVKENQIPMRNDITPLDRARVEASEVRYGHLSGMKIGHLIVISSSIPDSIFFLKTSPSLYLWVLVDQSSVNLRSVRMSVYPGKTRLNKLKSSSRSARVKM